MIVTLAERLHRRREDQDDRRDDDQLDERVAAVCAATAAWRDSRVSRVMTVAAFMLASYFTVTVAGANCSAAAAPVPATVPTPVIVERRDAGRDRLEQHRRQQPGADRAGLIARPRDHDVDAARRGSACDVNAAAMPPCRMKVPSCTLRTRTTAGL